MTSGFFVGSRDGYALGLMCYERKIWPCELAGKLDGPVPVDSYNFMMAFLDERHARIQDHNEMVKTNG